MLKNGKNLYIEKLNMERLIILTKVLIVFLKLFHKVFHNFYY